MLNLRNGLPPARTGDETVSLSPLKVTLTSICLQRWTWIFTPACPMLLPDEDNVGQRLVRVLKEEQDLPIKAVAVSNKYGR